MAGAPEWAFMGYRCATRDLSTIDRTRKTRSWNVNAPFLLAMRWVGTPELTCIVPIHLVIW